MEEQERKRWWRLVAVALMGGGVAVGSWVNLIHPVTAEPIPKLTAVLDDQAIREQGVWTRASNPLSQPASSPSAPVTPASGAPASQTFTGPVVPTGGTGSSVLVIPSYDPGTPGPRSSDTTIINSASQLPNLPTIPSPTALPNAVPVPTPSIPIIPVQAIGSPISSPSVSSIPTPALPPANTAVPAPIEVTPAAPPLRFPDTIQPVMPVKPEMSLPGGNGGISVKSDNPPPIGVVVPGYLNPAAQPVQGIATPTIPAPPISPVIPPVPEVRFPATLIDRPKTGENLLQQSEKDTFPLNSLTGPDSFKTSTPGDDTMRNSYKHAATLAILGGLFMGHTNPSFAADPKAADDKDKELADWKEHAKKTNEQLKAIQEQLAKIQAEQVKINEVLKGKKDEKGIPSPYDTGVVEKLNTLTDKLADIEKEFQKLQKSSTSNRLAAPVNPILDPTAGKSIVRIANEYPVKISMVVNGTSYEVLPNKTLDVTVPAGSFSYQLLQSGASQTTGQIKEKETVTLRIK